MEPAALQDRRRPASVRPAPAAHRPADAEASSAALPIGQMDGGARQRFAAHLQRSVGNRAMSGIARRVIQREEPSVWDIAPNPYATTEKGGGATTELPGNPYAVENDPVTLSNPR